MNLLGSLRQYLEDRENQGYRAVIADKGYDSKKFANYIEKQNAEVVIPSRSNAKEPRVIDDNLYKDRNKIERLFSRSLNTL